MRLVEGHVIQTFSCSTQVVLLIYRLRLLYHHDVSPLQWKGACNGKRQKRAVLHGRPKQWYSGKCSLRMAVCGALHLLVVVLWFGWFALLQARLFMAGVRVVCSVLQGTQFPVCFLWITSFRCLPVMYAIAPALPTEASAQLITVRFDTLRVQVPKYRVDSQSHHHESYIYTSYVGVLDPQG